EQVNFYTYTQSTPQLQEEHENTTFTGTVTKMEDCFNYQAAVNLTMEYAAVSPINKNPCYIHNPYAPASDNGGHLHIGGPFACPVSITPGGNWSDPNSWPNKYVPVDGEDVYIENYMSIVLDVNSTAKLGRLSVHGELIFSDNAENVKIVA
ncbi:unnamed protein product, partial [Amoebophrya sp. A120]